MSEIYETGRYVDEYLLFHYGNAQQILPWELGPVSALDFPVRTVGYFSKDQVERSLDVGCAVGRSTLEMSRFSKEVIGIDFSNAFIEAAEKIKSGDSMVCERLEEAKVSTQVDVSAPSGVELQRVTYEVGDAMNLRDDLGTFDRVHAANLVCRLPDPRKFLDRLSSLVNLGGEQQIPCCKFATDRSMPTRCGKPDKVAAPI